MPLGLDGTMAVTTPVSALMELQDTMTAQRSKIGNFYAVYIYFHSDDHFFSFHM